MQISKITGISPAGSFESQYGTMYSFTLSFEDGVIGQASAKSNPPAYRVGDTVGYDITGSFKGMNKLKVTKNPDRPFTPQTPPPVTAPAHTAPVKPPPRTFAARSESLAVQSVNGATAGMCVKEAIPLALQAANGGPESMQFWEAVEEYARKLVSICQSVERGTTPKPSEQTDRSAPPMRFTPAPQDVDEDVPF